MQYPSNPGFYKYDSAHWPGVEYNLKPVMSGIYFSIYLINNRVYVLQVRSV